MNHYDDPGDHPDPMRSTPGTDGTPDYCDRGSHTWCDDPACDCECHEHQQYDDDSETWRNYP